MKSGSYPPDHLRAPTGAASPATDGVTRLETSPLDGCCESPVHKPRCGTRRDTVEQTRSGRSPRMMTRRASLAERLSGHAWGFRQKACTALHGSARTTAWPSWCRWRPASAHDLVHRRYHGKTRLSWPEAGITAQAKAGGGCERVKIAPTRTHTGQSWDQTATARLRCPWTTGELHPADHLPAARHAGIIVESGAKRRRGTSSPPPRVSSRPVDDLSRYGSSAHRLG